MIVAIASGKGGTGKTSVAVNMALSVGNVQLLDCDVEEPNAYLFLKPKISQTQAVTVSIPVVNDKLCNRCGKCADFCQYNALFVSTNEVMVFPSGEYTVILELFVRPTSRFPFPVRRINVDVLSKGPPKLIEYTSF